MDSSLQTQAGQGQSLRSPMGGPSSHYDNPVSSTVDSESLQVSSEFRSGSSQSERDPIASVHPLSRQRMAGQSQYYITFSVTGIERSNVKNPIIRFDAKVAEHYITFANH
jgi:hypothetical protein